MTTSRVLASSSLLLLRRRRGGGVDIDIDICVVRRPIRGRLLLSPGTAAAPGRGGRRLLSVPRGCGTEGGGGDGQPRPSLPSSSSSSSFSSYVKYSSTGTDHTATSSSSSSRSNWDRLRPAALFGLGLYISMALFGRHREDKEGSEHFEKMKISLHDLDKKDRRV